MNESFESLVGRHLDPLHRFALSLTRNRDEAKDLLHDTFLKGFQGFHRFQAGTNFRAWIFAILVNTFRTRARDRGRHPQIALEDVPEPACEGEVVFELLAEGEILCAIEDLPEPYRSTVLLVDREEMRYAEVAIAMDCPAGTVMSRLHRGRSMLRTRLAGLAAERGFQVAKKTGRRVE